MKTQRQKRPEGRAPGTRRSEGGSVVLVFVTLLAMMMILFTTNSRALVQLHRNLKALEQRQIKRLNASQTNAVAVVELPVKGKSP